MVSSLYYFFGVDWKQYTLIFGKGQGGIWASSVEKKIAFSKRFIIFKSVFPDNMQIIKTKCVTLSLQTVLNMVKAIFDAKKGERESIG